MLRSAERLWGKIDIAKWLTFLELDVMKDLCNKRTEPSTIQTQFEGLEFCWFERKYMSKFAVKLAVTNYLLCKLERIDFPNMFASVFKAIYLDSTPFTDLNSFMFDFNTLIVLEIEFKLSKPLWILFYPSFCFVSFQNNLKSFTIYLCRGMKFIRTHHIPSSFLDPDLAPLLSTMCLDESSRF